MDLNIDNYNLNELLKIFKLEHDFDYNQLKEAKKIVYKMHPDKSKLPKEYFLFFSKAYKLVVQIFEFRNKYVSKVEDVEYDNVKNVTDEECKIIMKNIKDKTKFSKFFNEMFDNMKIKNESFENGYNDWLKEENDDNDDNSKDWKTRFNERKNQKKALTIFKETQDNIDNISCGHNMLDDSIPDNYSNNQMFSKNPYIDVKEAYDNPVIPVNDETYNNIKKFNNVLEMQNHRKKTEISPSDQLKKQQEMFLKKKNNMDVNNANNTAFKLANQVAESEKNNNIFWSKLKLLEN